jgi:predicted nucleotide-binding protein
MARLAGVPNKNYPALSFREAMQVAETIANEASGHPIDRLLLADAMDSSPSSSVFRAKLSASRAYGLTEGTEKADRVSLTDLGARATADEPSLALAARRQAGMSPEPFKKFVDEFANRKLPSQSFLEKWLQDSADVPQPHASDAARILLDNARSLGLLRTIKGAEYVFREGSTQPDLEVASEGEGNTAETEIIGDASETDTSGATSTPARSGAASDAPRAGKVFIGHGKNKTPLEQLKSMLKMLGIEVAVAIDEPHAGRPISQKVAEAMRECTSACFVLTADEKYSDASGGEQWRPSDNAIYELGAASILYGRRIVIFREKDVTFASDFSDLGYITFEHDHLDATMADLLKELVAFGIVEIRAAR